MNSFIFFKKKTPENTKQRTTKIKTKREKKLF